MDMRSNQHLRRRSRWAAGGAVAALLLAGTGVTAPPAAALTGSSFDEANGKLVAVAPKKDWIDFKSQIACAGDVKIGCGTDKVKSSADDGYGQGSKDDDTTLTLVDQQVPPSKTDLERAYVATETIGSNVFMYFSWVRSNTNGTTNFSIELNENLPTVAGNKQTFDRTNARLITWDLENGGSSVQLAAYRWIPAGGGGSCEKASAPPCWGDRQDLDAKGFANGSMNQAPFTSANSVSDPITETTLAKGTFGEAAVNMTAAGLLGVCGGLGSVTVRSRSSSSFGSELKDTIASFQTAAQLPVDVSGANANGKSFGYSLSLKDKGTEKIPADLRGPTPTSESSQTGAGTTNGSNGYPKQIVIPDEDQRIGNQTIKKGGILTATLLQTLAQSAVGKDPAAARQVSRAALVDLTVLRDGITTEDFTNENPVVAADAVTAEAQTLATPDESRLLSNGSGLTNLNLWGAAKGSSTSAQEYQLPEFGPGSAVQILTSSANSGNSPEPGKGQLGQQVTWEMNQKVVGLRVYLYDINRPAEAAWTKKLLDPLGENPFADGTQTLELVVSSVEAQSTFPTTLCAAPQAVAGHAYLLKADVPGILTATHGFVSIPRTGGAAVSSPGTIEVAVPGLNGGPGFTVATLSAAKTASQGDPTSSKDWPDDSDPAVDAATADSLAAGGTLCVLKGTLVQQGCLVEAQLVSVASQSAASLTKRAASTGFTVTSLTVLGKTVPVNAGSIKIQVPGLDQPIGTIVINEEIEDPASSGHAGKLVRALRVTIDTPQLLDDLIKDLQATLGTTVTVPGKVEVIVLEAHSGATFLPFAA